MMPRLQILSGRATACAVLLLTASQVQAQGPRPAWSRTFLQHPIALAMLDDVAGELKLTDEQKTKVRELNDEMRAERGAIFQSAAGDFDQIRKEMNELNAEMQKELNDALDEAQQKRIREVYLQVNGPLALQDEAVVQSLDLSDEQKTKLDAAITEARMKMFGSFQELAGMPPEDADKRREAMASERDEAYLALLTEDQRAKFDEMKGAEFAVDLSKLPNPFGG